jgi:hypothetical protein
MADASSVSTVAFCSIHFSPVQQHPPTMFTKRPATNSPMQKIIDSIVSSHPGKPALGHATTYIGDRPESSKRTVDVEDIPRRNWSELPS